MNTKISRSDAVAYFVLLCFFVFSVFFIYKVTVGYGLDPHLLIIFLSTFGVFYLSPIFMIGLLLSRKMACIEGLGLWLGYLLNNMPIPNILIFYLLITGISVGLIGSMIGEKLNIPRQHKSIDIALGILSLIIVFAFYYHFPIRQPA